MEEIKSGCGARHREDLHPGKSRPASFLEDQRRMP
jgi:hypothetical protein